MSYYKERSHLPYYRIVQDWLDHLYVPSPNSLLDVGGWDTPVCTWGRFNQRFLVDKNKVDLRPGYVETFQEDWLEFPLRERTGLDKVSVITCLQVIEHLDKETAIRFCKKLRDSAETVIVSVPYKWAQCQYHQLDPMDLGMVCELMQDEPIRMQRTAERLVAHFGPIPQRGWTHRKIGIGS